MNASLDKAIEHLHQIATELIDRLRVAARDMSAGRSIQDAQLLNEFTQFKSVEKQTQKEFSETFSELNIDHQIDFYLLSWSQMQDFLDPLARLESARREYQILQETALVYGSSNEQAQKVNAQLEHLEQILAHPAWPLSEEIFALSGKTHSVFENMEDARLVYVRNLKAATPPPSSVIEVEPEAPKQGGENLYESLFNFPEEKPKPVESSPAPPTPENPEVLEPESYVEENIEPEPEKEPAPEPGPEADPEPVLLDDTVVTDESNFENDFIFDDFDSSDSHKQILTSQDLSERIEALENQPIASAEDETPAADHNDDSIFDDDSPPGQSSTETLKVSSSSEPSTVDLSYESDPSFSDARLGDLDYEHVIEYARKSEDAQNRFDRASYLGRLTWELISQGEYALAYQVSNCLVVNTDKELTLPAPPPWLLALLVMGDHVRLSSGRIAREFETIVDEHREEAKSITADPNTPEAYLLRAALMRGAVTTASVAAADILRAFSIVPNQTQLYNYCSRVASFASRSNGLRLDQYFYRPGAASTESEARVIRARVISWRPTAFKDILPYDVATPLFSQAYWSVQTPTALRKPELVQEWRTRQVLLAHITRMLQPILDNRLNQSHLVESEFDACHTA